MHRVRTRKVLLIVLVCAGVASGMACCPGDTPPQELGAQECQKPMDDPKDTQEIPLEAQMLDDARTFDVQRDHPTIKVVEVRRGQALRFFAKDATAWILIPDGRLRRGTGGEDWNFTKSYISFKIDMGQRASIRVPQDYPDHGDDKEIYYSILAFNGEIWEYVHGSSPPRVIIPR